MGLRWWGLVVHCVAVAGCGPDAPSDDPGADAAVDAAADAGAGIPAGCPDGEAPAIQGGCRPVGVAPDACGAGFRAEEGGCVSVLAAERCGPGEVSVPGDEVCHVLADCGEGPWGDIPVERDTEYVDATSVDGNGSADRPWSTIQRAIDVAGPGAIIAIAEGSYVEDVYIHGKEVHLWGRCPALVEIVGTSAHIAAIDIREGADETEIHALAVRSASNGVSLSGSQDVVLDRVWTHDTAWRGIVVQNVLGSASLQVLASLVELTHGAGVFAAGAELTMEGSVVRTTGPHPDWGDGRGLHLQWNEEPAVGTVRSSVFEDNESIGVVTTGAELTLEESVVRGTVEGVGEALGRGVEVEDDPDSATRSTATIRSCVIEDNHEVGLFIGGSDAVVESSTVARTLPTEDDGAFGQGIAVVDNPASAEPSDVVIRGSAVVSHHAAGVYVGGSRLVLEGTLVRDIQPDAGDDRFGRCLHVQAGVDTGLRSTLELRESLLERCSDLGVSITGADATVEALLVRNVAPQASDGKFGDGIAVWAQDSSTGATVSITGSRVEGAARAGIASFGADVSVADSELACNPIAIDGEPYLGFDFAFDDAGGNVCGCDALEPCAVQSSGLEPPSLLAL